MRFALSDEQREFGAVIHELLAGAGVPGGRQGLGGRQPRAGAGDLA